MPSRLQLEMFDAPDRAGEILELSRGEIEEERLAAFDKGYAAGWEDAVAAQDADAAAVRATLQRSVEDMRFTYQEAYRHILSALEPLLADMVGKVLPALARRTLGQVVLEHLLPAARDMAARPVGVTLHPVARAEVEPLLLAEAGLSFEITEDPGLGPGEVFLRFEGGETRIDLDGVVAAIGEAVEGFFGSALKEARAHG